MKLNHILSPVDLSPASASALRMAGVLARALKAGLTVLHAQRWELPPYFTVAQTEKMQSQFRKSGKAARRYFEDFAAKVLPKDLPRTLILLEEDAVTAILHAAHQAQADLIVMGTHGRTGWNRIRLGSVMEGVLRQAAVPVLAVGPHASASGKIEAIRNILCPVSLDGLSRAAVDTAVLLSGKLEAKLTAMHVVEPGALSSDSMRSIETRLREWVAPRAAGQCPIHPVVRAGSITESIVREAGEAHADLLIIHTQRQESLGSIIFGTKTELLIRSAPCAVLVIPEQDQARPKAGGNTSKEK